MSSSNRSSIFERNPKKTVFILLFILLICFDLLAALVLRVTGLYDPNYNTETYYRIKNEIYHHDLAPNIDNYDAQWGPLSYKISTNSLGFKDDSTNTVMLKTNKPRILFIGDSFTEGIGYDYTDTFVGKLEQKLSGMQVDVLNAAVGSYSPIIYHKKIRYLIEEKGLWFEHLIVLIDISDIQDDAIFYYLDEHGNVQKVHNTIEDEFDEKFKKFITRNTIILRNLRFFLHNLKVKERKLDYHKALNIPRSLWASDEKYFNEFGKGGLALSSGYMDQLYNLLRQHNISLSIAVYPWPDQIIKRDIDSVQVRFWQQWSTKRNVKFIDLFPEFINETEPETMLTENFIPGDIHWNAKGHQIMADGLYPHLVNLVTTKSNPVRPAD